MVGGELEGGLLFRVGEPRSRADELDELPDREAERRESPVSRFKGKRGTLSCRFTTGAFGEVVANPKHLEHAQKNLRRLGRQATRRVGPDRRTRQEPSKRWRKTAARIARAHAQVANAREDGLHKLSTRLVREHTTVVVEDLNVAGMVRNRRLARRVAGVGMGEFRRQVEYKAGWCSTRVLVADRWYPSSKTCSACGVVKAKLRLSERIYICDGCGLRIDRDLNAARSLSALAWASSSSCGATVNEPDGNPRQTRIARAAGIATGRPGPSGAGQRRRRQASTRETFSHVS
ncbi:RNA-guided endonuclease TnpB family protein [Rhodococcus sp. NPDC003318]|uniref:RNA-guided endonuclease TnpB family protein n=1 Tax=Rhodococcus sp. NPDC003318 TaxID=3364503 RepID=UPI0036A7FBC0